MLEDLEKQKPLEPGTKYRIQYGAHVLHEQDVLLDAIGAASEAEIEQSGGFTAIITKLIAHRHTFWDCVRAPDS